jgi:hypothetical protein
LPTIPYNPGVEFPKLPTSTPILCQVEEANFVNEPNPFFGKADAQGKIDERKTRDVVRVVFKSIEDEYWGAKIWKTFGASIHEQSALRPFIQATEPKDLTTEELKTFNTDSLVGRYVAVIGGYKEGDAEQKFLKPTSYVRAKKKDVDAALAAGKSRPATAPARSEGTVRELVAAASGSEIDF